MPTCLTFLLNPNLLNISKQWGGIEDQRTVARFVMALSSLSLTLSSLITDNVMISYISICDRINSDIQHHNCLGYKAPNEVPKAD